VEIALEARQCEHGGRARREDRVGVVTATCVQDRLPKLLGPPPHGRIAEDVSQPRRAEEAIPSRLAAGRKLDLSADELVLRIERVDDCEPHRVKQSKTMIRKRIP
jgi:hypothetical protein